MPYGCDNCEFAKRTDPLLISAVAWPPGAYCMIYGTMASYLVLCYCVHTESELQWPLVPTQYRLPLHWRNQFFQGEGRNDSFTSRERERASDYHHNESLLLILLLCTTKAFEQYAFALSRRVGALQISIICSRGNNLWGTITLWSRRVVPLEPLAQTRTKLKKKRKSLSLIIFVFYCADHV